MSSEASHPDRMTARSMDALQARITQCHLCSRLVEWREQVAVEKRASFRDDEYWGRPVPSFGDPNARVLVVGLAPVPALPTKRLPEASYLGPCMACQ